MKFIFQSCCFYIVALCFTSSCLAGEADFPPQGLINEVVKRCQLLRVDMDENEVMKILKPESVTQMGRPVHKNYHFKKKGATYFFYINIHLIALAKDGPLVLSTLPSEAVVSTEKTVTVIRFAKSKIPNLSMVDTIRDSKKLSMSPYKSVELKVIELDSASK